MFDFVFGFFDSCYIMDCLMLKPKVTCLHLLGCMLKGNKNSCTSGFKMPFNAGGEPRVHLMHLFCKKCFQMMTALKIFPKNVVESTGYLSTNETANERGGLLEVYL